MMNRLNDVLLLRPDFRAGVQWLMSELAAQQIPLMPYETVRSPGRQNVLFARGRDPNAVDFGRTVTRARAYESAHQFAVGTDFAFRLADGSWSWDEPERGMWDSYTRLAKTCGLETLSFEKPHVQAIGFDWRRMERGPMDTAGWLAWLERPQEHTTL